MIVHAMPVQHSHAMILLNNNARDEMECTGPPGTCFITATAMVVIPYGIKELLFYSKTFLLGNYPMSLATSRKIRIAEREPTKIRTSASQFSLPNVHRWAMTRRTPALPLTGRTGSTHPDRHVSSCGGTGTLN